MMNLTVWIMTERERLNAQFREITSRLPSRSGYLHLDVRCFLIDTRIYLSRIHDLLGAQ
jgi:hypothetical protein